MKSKAYTKRVGCIVALVTAFLVAGTSNAFAAGAITINLQKGGKIPTVFIVTTNPKGEQIKTPLLTSGEKVTLPEGARVEIASGDPSAVIRIEGTIDVNVSAGAPALQLFGDPRVSINPELVQQMQIYVGSGNPMLITPTGTTPLEAGHVELNVNPESGQVSFTPVAGGPVPLPGDPSQVPPAQPTAGVPASGATGTPGQAVHGLLPYNPQGTGTVPGTQPIPGLPGTTQGQPIPGMPGQPVPGLPSGTTYNPYGTGTIPGTQPITGLPGTTQGQPTAGFSSGMPYSPYGTGTTSGTTQSFTPFSGMAGSTAYASPTPTGPLSPADQALLQSITVPGVDPTASAYTPPTTYGAPTDMATTGTFATATTDPFAATGTVFTGTYTDPATTTATTDAFTTTTSTTTTTDPAAFIAAVESSTTTTATTTQTTCCASMDGFGHCIQWMNCTPP